MPSKLPLSARVWDKLSSINVNEHVEKKGNLSYLSWAWAWDILMQHYPNATYDFKPAFFYADGSCEVWCTVTITENDEQMFRDMWLPVMDNRNNAVTNPDARLISDTRMRCLVKCLAIFGLGHYLYAGEDLPVMHVSYTSGEKKFYDAMFEAKSPLGFYAISQKFSEEAQKDLFNSFPAGAKVKGKDEVRDLETKGTKIAATIMEKIGEDDSAVMELIEDEPVDAIRAFGKLLDTPTEKSLLFLMQQRPGEQK